MLRGAAPAVIFVLNLSVVGMYAAPDIQQQRLIYQLRPLYPKLAREARIEGTVRLAAEISKRGRVDRLRLISGHPLLVKAAMDAVSEWRYEPCRYFGVPVAVRTEISVTFSLSREDGSGQMVHV